MLIGAAFAAPALALIGALATACFAKAFGGVFLGTARTEPAARAHESAPSMTGPMLVLVGCCIFIGLAPPVVARPLDQAITAWAPDMPAAELQLARLAPLGWISTLAVGLLGAILALGLWLRSRLQGAVAYAETWGCGYAAPGPTMQYTSSSFAEMLVHFFRWALRPNVHQARIEGLFARSGSFESHIPDTVLDKLLWPAFRSAAWLFSWFRVLQQGHIQLYLSYLFIALLALLLWSTW
jgi:hydrogenase-4 component B